MVKESLKFVIKEFHETPIPSLIERRQGPDPFILDSPIRKIITIIGPRRAGKTYFLFQIIRRLLNQGWKKTDMIYINFEDERIMPMSPGDLQYILDAYFELYGHGKKPIILFDEIQNIDNWDKFVRRINEQGYHVFITGSNSKMLARDIATALRGRTITYEILPFSFSEFLAAKGIMLDKNFLYGKHRHKIRQLYDEYFFSGGFPEIVLTKDKAMKNKILQDYFNTVFYKDLAERYRIKNTELLRRWLNTLTANISCLISLSKVENDFKSQGMHLSKATLASFARYVEDVFFGFFVEIYSDSPRKRQANPRKFYLVDVGIYNYLTLKFSENKGRLLENLVYIALRRKRYPTFYYRTGAGQEVDFLIKGSDGDKLIQVCYSLINIDTFNREKKALLSAMKELGLKDATILTYDEKRKEELGEHTINILPVWEWLLIHEV